MNSDLVHATCEWFAENDTGCSIEAKFLELCQTILAFGRHFADTNFVADHLNRLRTLDDATT